MRQPPHVRPRSFRHKVTFAGLLAFAGVSFAFPFWYFYHKKGRGPTEQFSNVNSMRRPLSQQDVDQMQAENAKLRAGKVVGPSSAGAAASAASLRKDASRTVVPLSPSETRSQ